MFVHSNKFIFRQYVKILGHYLSTKSFHEIVFLGKKIKNFHFQFEYSAIVETRQIFSVEISFEFLVPEKKITFLIACFCSGERKSEKLKPFP